MEMKLKKELEKNFYNQDRVKALDIFVEDSIKFEELEAIKCYTYFCNFISKNKKLQSYKFWLIGYSMDYFDEEFLSHQVQFLQHRITPLNLYGDVRRKFFKEKNGTNILKIMELDWCNFLEALELNRVFFKSFIVASKRSNILSNKNFNEIYRIISLKNDNKPVSSTWDSLYGIDWINVAINMGKNSDFIIRGLGYSSHEAYVQIVMDKSLLHLFKDIDSFS